MLRRLLTLLLMLACSPVFGQSQGAPTNFRGKGVVEVFDDFGGSRVFSSADSDTARWTAFDNATNYATSLGANAKKIVVGPGTFAAGSANMDDLPTGCKLIGAGKDKTTFTTTSNSYPFLELITNCTYEGFTITQDSATNTGSPMGLTEGNTAACTGWTVRDVALTGDIDAIFFSGSGNYSLQGELINLTGRSAWDVLRINNVLLTSIDLKIVNPDFQATGNPAIESGSALATGLSINAAGGTVKVFGGQLAGFQGNQSSYAVLNEGTGCTIELLGGVRLETSAPAAGEQMHVVAAAPVIVGAAVDYDPTKTRLGNVQYASDGVQRVLAGEYASASEVDNRLTLQLNKKLVNPTSITATLISSGGTYGAAHDPVQYRVWTYKTIDGTRYYSDSYAESSSLSPTNPPVKSITLAIATDGTEDGVKIGRTTAGGGYVTYREIAATGSGAYALTDTSSGWTSQDPVVVTPLYDERVHLNYETGGTLYGVWSPTVPASIGSLTLATDLSVANGGTGASTLTGLVKGNGTSAFTAAVQGTDYYAPGGTDVAVADGGTGAGTAAGGRANLGANLYHFESEAPPFANPTDSATYYFSRANFANGTTAGAGRIYPMQTGTIKRVRFIFYCYGTLGSNETSTLYLRLNNTSDTTLSTTVVNNAVTYSELVTGLNVAITEGDYVEFKWVAPNWVATNPTQISFHAEVEMER